MNATGEVMSKTLAHGQPYQPYCVSYIYTTPSTAAGGSATLRTCAECGYLIVEGSTHVCPVITFTPTVAPAGSVPHKCPCCDGWGQRNNVAPLDCVSERMEMCRACNGSGIIWGLG